MLLTCIVEFDWLIIIAVVFVKRAVYMDDLAQ